VWGRREVDLAGTSDDEGAIVELIVGAELQDGSLDLRNQLGRWERKVGADETGQPGLAKLVVASVVGFRDTRQRK
jgi:hypothetical protein